MKFQDRGSDIVIVTDNFEEFVSKKLFVAAVVNNLLQISGQKITPTSYEFSSVKYPVEATIQDLVLTLNTWASGNDFHEVGGGTWGAITGDITNQTDLQTALAVAAAPDLHDILSPTHSDSVTGAPVRGDIIIGNATPKWDKLAVGAAGTVLIGGTDPSYSATPTITTLTLANDAIIKVGGTAVRATTEGKRHIDLFDFAAPGDLPVGTLAGGLSIFSRSGILSSLNSAGLLAYVTMNPTPLVNTRVPFANANGQLVDSAAMTFVTDTLTVTKIGSTTMTGTTIHTGSMIVKSVNDAGPMTATGGTVAEIVYNSANSHFYGCTVTGITGTWIDFSVGATATIVDDVATAAVMYPTWVTANSGNLPLKVSSTKLSFTPSTGTLALTGVLNVTGTGTISTSTTTPLVVGGTAVGSPLILKASSHAAPTTDYIAFQTGAAVEAMRIINGGPLIVGATALLSSELFSVQKSQNALTYIAITNMTSGTAGRAGIGVYDAASKNIFIASVSAGYTSSGLHVASCGVLSTNQTAGMNIGTTIATQLSFWTNNTKKVELSAVGNLSLGGVATRSGTVGAAAMQIFNGTAPVGTLANGVSLYAVAGKLWAMDSLGNPTQLTP